MGTVHKYATPNSVETVLSTGLNSLGNGAAAVSGVIDNATDLYKFADFEIYASSGGTTAGTYYALYLIESEDGTNYEDSTIAWSGISYGGVAQLIGTVSVPQVLTIRKVLRGVALPPTKFKIILVNASGFTLAASGNLVRMIRYNEQDV